MQHASPQQTGNNQEKLEQECVSALLLLAALLARVAAARGSTALALLASEHVRQPAESAVLPVEVRGHEYDRPTAGADLPQPSDLAVAVNLVVLEHRKLDLLVLVLDLLG